MVVFDENIAGMGKEPFYKPLSLEFIVSSVLLFVNLALDQADVHLMVIARLSCIVGAALTINGVRRTAWAAKVGKNSIKFILTCVFIGFAWLLFGLWQQHRKDEKLASQPSLNVIQPMVINGPIETGSNPALVMNVINTTGEVVKARLAKSVFIVTTPRNFEKRLALENAMWNHLEENYKDRGLDQDLPARGEGVSNLRITEPRPLTEFEARGISDGSLTIYFLSVTRNRQSQADLVEVCAFMGPERDVRLCGYHNKP